MKNYQRVILGAIGGAILGKLFFGSEIGFTYVLQPAQKLTNSAVGTLYRADEADDNFETDADGFQ